jgi:hypothetical protein
MHLTDETNGQALADLTAEIDDTDLSDEALDRARVRGAFACRFVCFPTSHPRAFR